MGLLTLVLTGYLLLQPSQVVDLRPSKRVGEGTDHGKANQVDVWVCQKVRMLEICLCVKSSVEG